jgi:hypothetical protein
MGDSAHTAVFIYLLGTRYSPPYNPGHDTLPPKMRVEIFTQLKKTRRKSIEFIKPYQFTSRKPGLKIFFRTHFWWQWVNKTTSHL